MVGLTELEQQAVRAEAVSWEGTPFHPKAAKKGVGVGCIELVVAVYQACGFLSDLPRVLRYPWGFWLNKSDDQFFAELMTRFTVVDAPWQVGDVLAFRGRPWPGTGHTAIFIGKVIGQETVVHALANRSVQPWPLAGTILEMTLHQGWRLLRG